MRYYIIPRKWHVFLNTPCFYIFTLMSLPIILIILSFSPLSAVCVCVCEFLTEMCFLEELVFENYLLALKHMKIIHASILFENYHC